MSHPYKQSVWWSQSNLEVREKFSEEDYEILRKLGDEGLLFCKELFGSALGFSKRIPHAKGPLPFCTEEELEFGLAESGGEGLMIAHAQHWAMLQAYKAGMQAVKEGGE